MATPAEPIRLALVDDHRMLLSALTEWIRNAADDIQMVTAVTTWPELLTSPGFPVDVVLLDLDLKDSIPVSLKISTLKTAGVKTVVMSTYSEPNVVREALGAGALGYLVKSEDAAMIVEAIRSAQRGEQYVSAELDLAINSGDVGGVPKLSAQERRVMALYGGGEPVKSVAYQLGISEETAKSYLKRIREKYRVAGFDVGTKVACGSGRSPTASSSRTFPARVVGVGPGPGSPGPVRPRSGRARPSRGRTTRRSASATWRGGTSATRAGATDAAAPTGRVVRPRAERSADGRRVLARHGSAAGGAASHAGPPRANRARPPGSPLAGSSRDLGGTPTAGRATSRPAQAAVRRPGGGAPRLHAAGPTAGPPVPRSRKKPPGSLPAGSSRDHGGTPTAGRATSRPAQAAVRRPGGGAPRLRAAGPTAGPPVPRSRKRPARIPSHRQFPRPRWDTDGRSCDLEPGRRLRPPAGRRGATRSGRRQCDETGSRIGPVLAPAVRTAAARRFVRFSTA